MYIVSLIKKIIDYFLIINLKNRAHPHTHKKTFAISEQGGIPAGPAASDLPRGSSWTTGGRWVGYFGNDFQQCFQRNPSHGNRFTKSEPWDH